MEVNKLTYRVYKFLTIKKGWTYQGKYDNKYIFLIPSSDLGFPQAFELKLPISNKSKDFYTYMKNILDLLSTIYDSKIKEIKKFNTLNENLKHRYTDEWIIPETKSKIETISTFDVYVPI
jgi:hypothetical protein